MTHSRCAPWRRGSPHCTQRSEPPVGDRPELSLCFIRSGIQGIQVIEEDVRHCVVPPVVAARRRWAVEIHILGRTVIEPVPRHRHPIASEERAHVVPRKSRADQRRQRVNGFARRCVRRTHIRMQQEGGIRRIIHAIRENLNEGEILSARPFLKDQTVVRENDALPIPHVIRGRKIRHQVDARNGCLLGPDYCISADHAAQRQGAKAANSAKIMEN